MDNTNNNENGTGALDSNADRIEYHIADIGDLTPRWEEKVLGDGGVRRVVEAVEIDGVRHETGDRFFKSVCSRFHFGASTFRYFDPAEVFTRIQEVQAISGRSEVRVAVEKPATEGASPILLGVSNPDRPPVGPNHLIQALDESGTEVISSKYREGIFTTTHKMSEEWSVGGDDFQQSFTMETPVDGYGLPSIYLSLIRQICTNGMIGYAPAFKSQIQLGKGKDLPTVALMRALSAFNNEEGFQSLRQRLEAAQMSLASVREVQRFEERLAKAMGMAGFTSLDIHGQHQIENVSGLQVWKSLGLLTGNVCDKYQVGAPDSISAKKQRLLPMNCTLYQLFNFATEVTTHHQELLKQPEQLHAWIGSIVTNEYDLELNVKPEQEDILGLNNQAFILNQ